MHKLLLNNCIITGGERFTRSYFAICLPLYLMLFRRCSGVYKTLIDLETKNRFCSFSLVLGNSTVLPRFSVGPRKDLGCFSVLGASVCTVTCLSRAAAGEEQRGQLAQGLRVQGASSTNIKIFI